MIKIKSTTGAVLALIYLILAILADYVDYVNLFQCRGEMFCGAPSIFISIPWLLLFPHSGIGGFGDHNNMMYLMIFSQLLNVITFYLIGSFITFIGGLVGSVISKILCHFQK